jgi:hypothetical protein
VEVLEVDEGIKQWTFPLDQYIAIYEDDEKVMTWYVAFLKDLKEQAMITPQELHEHIQSTVFGRPIGEAEGKHFDALQWRLHELVDGTSEITAVRDFVERVKHQAEQYELSTESIHSWYAAMTDVLTQMEQEAKP